MFPTVFGALYAGSPPAFDLFSGLSLIHIFAFAACCCCWKVWSSDRAAGSSSFPLPVCTFLCLSFIIGQSSAECNLLLPCNKKTDLFFIAVGREWPRFIFSIYASVTGNFSSAGHTRSRRGAGAWPGPRRPRWRPGSGGWPPPCLSRPCGCPR